MTLDCPEVVCQNLLARERPELFPFHASEVYSEEDWRRLLSIVWVAQRQIQKHPADYAALSSGRVHTLVEAFSALASRLDLADNLRPMWQWSDNAMWDEGC